MLSHCVFYPLAKVFGAEVLRFSTQNWKEEDSFVFVWQWVLAIPAALSGERPLTRY
jgi:hypothetical protein